MPTPQGLRVEYMPLSALKERRGNPKRHRLNDLQSSYDRHGYVDPLMLNETNGELLRGHGRLRSLSERKHMGLEPPPRVRVDDATGEWLVPVVRGVTIPEAEHDAYLLADNRLTERGGWDETALSAMLLAVGDLTGTGFDALDPLTVTPAEETPPDLAELRLRPYEHWDYVVLLFKDHHDWLSACDALGIEKVRWTNTPGRGSTHKVGLGRVVDGAAVVKRLRPAE